LKQLLIILILGFSISSTAQQLNIDSLKDVWNDETQADTTRLKSIKKFSWDGYLYSQPDSAFYFAQLQYEFANKKGLQKQMAEALNTQGVSFVIRGNYNKAIGYFNRYLKIVEKIDNKSGIAKALNNFGAIYFRQGNYSKSINYYTQSLKLNQEIDSKLGTANALNNIGNIYIDQGDYNKAIDYYSQSLKIKEEIGDKSGIAGCLNNLGNSSFDRQNYEDALNYYLRSLEIMGEIGSKQGIAKVLNNIGNIYIKQLNYNKSLDYYTKSYNIRKEIDDQPGMASSLNRIGTLYNKSENYTKAINFSSKALTIAKEIGTAVEIEDAAKNLYEAYKKTNQHQLSLEMYELYNIMHDSLENIAAQKEIMRQEFKYNYDKQTLADSLAFEQQRKVDALTYQSERKTTIGGFILFLLLITVLLWIRFIKNKAERTKLLQEIKIYKAEAVAKMISSKSIEEQLHLDKEKIELVIDSTLNNSDWKILNALYKNPAISNKELAEIVSLSVEGTSSSLRKMYRLFNVKTARNQRIALVIEATRVSNNS
jgi:tetratricopeptide (TPR) repeat protein